MKISAILFIFITLFSVKSYSDSDSTEPAPSAPPAEKSATDKLKEAAEAMKQAAEAIEKEKSKVHQIEYTSETQIKQDLDCGSGLSDEQKAQNLRERYKDKRVKFSGKIAKIDIAIPL